MSIELKPTDRSEYYMAYDENGNVAHVGVLDVGLRLTTGQPNLVHSPNENDYLSLVNSSGNVSNLTPMPALGDLCNAQEIYSHNDKAYICRQEHNRTEHDPEIVPALFSAYRENSEGEEWIPNEQVAVGNIRLDEGVAYEAIQAHMTQDNWNPSAMPALWKLASTGEIMPWVQPTGAQDAYALGAQVTHNGSTWESEVANNVWEPGAAGSEALWTEI